MATLKTANYIDDFVDIRDQIDDLIKNDTFDAEAIFMLHDTPTSLKDNIFSESEIEERKKIASRMQLFPTVALDMDIKSFKIKSDYGGDSSVFATTSVEIAEAVIKLDIKYNDNYILHAFIDGYHDKCETHVNDANLFLDRVNSKIDPTNKINMSRVELFMFLMTFVLGSYEYVNIDELKHCANAFSIFN